MAIFSLSNERLIKGVSVVDSHLNVDGAQFQIQGVTYSKEPLEKDFQLMKEMGVNAIRTWGVSDSTERLLDFSQKYNIKVLLGIWMRHGRSSAEGDDNFDWVHDEKGKNKQLKDTIAAVKKYRKHPALLAWGVGNEVTLNIATKREKICYARFLEKISKAVKRLDSKHPVSSISAWTTDVPFWKRFCKSIDIYGVNVYGYGAYALPHALNRLKVYKPFFLGEFGPTGEWEARLDANGVKVEPSDLEKYRIFAEVWPKIKATAGQRFLGGFFFNYGDELNFAGIWLNMFINNRKRPSYWGARKAFIGQSETHGWPRIEKFVLINAKTPQACGSWVQARVEVSREMTASDKISFYYNQRQGMRKERDAVIPMFHELGGSAIQYRVKLPSKPGPTKIYAFLEDAHCNLMIASTSVQIISRTGLHKL